MATGSDMYYEHVCSPCEGDGLNNEATTYCKQCGTPLCDTCVKQHNRFLKDHTLVGRGELERWIPAKYDFQKNHVFTITSERKVNVRAAGNRNMCKINGMCLMHDGRIMMADYNNGSLKLLNKTYDSVRDLNLPKPYLPNGVCHVNGREYASCVRDGENRRAIHFNLKDNDDIEILNTFLLNHKAGMIRHSNGHLYVQSDTGLYVYSMVGSLIDVLFRDISSTGCEGFDFSDNCKKIHVAHFDAQYMTTITSEGRKLASWTDASLKRTPCVIALPNGALIICGSNRTTETVKIAQVSTDGRKTTGTLLKRGFDDMWPISMVYIKQTSELLVGGESDNLLLFTLG